MINARIQSPAQTVQIEQRDRVRRLKRLAHASGLPSPDLTTDLSMPAESLSGVDYDVPVIRFRYSASALFAVDSAELSPKAKRILESIATSMAKDVPDVHVLIVGHTDATASVEYNQKLSEARARNSYRYLMARGVPSRQMSFIGMSERQPIAPNSTANGRALNRRVEFLISSYKEANFHFAETRAIICDFLDPKEFNLDTCLKIAKIEHKTVNSDTADRGLSIDPTENEIVESIQQPVREVDSTLQAPIQINPSEHDVESDIHESTRDVEIHKEAREIVIKPPKVVNVDIE